MKTVKTFFEWITGALIAMVMVPIIVLLLPVVLLRVWLDRTNYDDIFDDLTENDLKKQL